MSEEIQNTLVVENLYFSRLHEEKQVNSKKERKKKDKGG